MPSPFRTFVTSAAIAVGAIAALDAIAHTAVSAQSRNPLTNDRPTVRPAPTWANTSWLNTPEGRPVTLQSLRGRVVLLNFWTFTCWNCTGAIPSLVDYDRKYRDQGLTIIGIHRPEFPPYAGEHDRGNVERALRQYHIGYPNAQDNDAGTWDLYRIRYWPSFVLIDKRGVIRYEGYGEFHLNDGTYQLWDRRIRELLEE